MHASYIQSARQQIILDVFLHKLEDSINSRFEININTWIPLRLSWYLGDYMILVIEI